MYKGYTNTKPLKARHYVRTKITTDETVTSIYPRLIKRIQALIIDSVIFSFLLVSLFLLISSDAVTIRWLRAVILLFPVLFLEPALVSYTGGTIGHHLLNLKIQKADKNKKINLFLAFIRFILKSILGWFSIIFVLTTKKHQAVHDFLVNSVVVYKDPAKLREHEALGENIIEEEGYIYPSKLRRILVIILYNILLLLLLGVISAFLLSEACFDNNKCTPVEEVISYGIGISWLVSMALILVGGWKSLLFGCKRKKIKSTEST